MCKKVVILFIILLSFSCMLLGCESDKAKVKITTSKEDYSLVIGESVSLNVMPDNIDYTFDIDNKNIVKIDEKGVISGQNTGFTSILIRHGESSKRVTCKVFDKIVSKDAKSMNRGRYQSVNTAVADAKDGDIILIESGRYDETVSIDADVTLIGEDNVVLNAIDIFDNHAVSLENIAFYSRDYLGKGRASLRAHEGVSLTAKSCTFFVDKKGVEPKDRLEGYAVYVYPNSHIVNISNCTFSCYKECIYIDSTGGEIDVTSNRFSHTNKGIIVDVRDMSENMPTNLNATGTISDNAFVDTLQEVDFLFAGSTYSGKLVIEKHDKV